jgi:hypothetical protein
MSIWLRLYPHAWRERYGDELEELLASEPRTLRMGLDLIAGAIDAHENPQWTPVAAPEGGHKTMITFLSSCGRASYTPKQQRWSAILMIGGSIGLILVYLGLKSWFGKSVMTEALLYSTFNIALVLSSLPTFLKSYPRNVRLSLLALGIGGSYGFFLLVTLFAERF